MAAAKFLLIAVLAVIIYVFDPSFSTLLLMAVLAPVVLIVLGIVFATLYGGPVIDGKAKESALRSIPGFNPTRAFVGLEDSSIAFDESTNTICCLTVRAGKLSHRLVRGEQLLRAEIFEDRVSVIETSRGSQLKGALVGGLAFGAAGAMVGGLSGLTVTQRQISRIELRLTVDDAQNPLHDVVFCTGAGDPQTTKILSDHAREWLGIMDIMIHRAA